MHFTPQAQVYLTLYSKAAFNKIITGLAVETFFVEEFCHTSDRCEGERKKVIQIQVPNFVRFRTETLKLDSGRHLGDKFVNHGTIPENGAGATI